MNEIEQLGGILDKIGGVAKSFSDPFLRAMGTQIYGAGKGAIIGGMIGGISGAGLGLIIGEFYGLYKGYEIMSDAGIWRDSWK